jgi:ubiquitin C-terminal hydrolase
LEDYGISIGQVVYVEFSNANNQWPSDKVTEGEKTKTPTSKVEKSDELRTAGLYNLGNSITFIFLYSIIACYMNSALQCIANTKFFYEYFVKE